MIIRKKYCPLGSRYDHVKSQVSSLLGDYVGDVFRFDDSRRLLLFQTETLIPECDPEKPNVLLLFSNPHPGSVRTGMFLCATGNNPHNFWWFMRDAGWFSVLDIDYVPENLRDIFTTRKHQGPFNLFFDCFYDFPTKDPEDLAKIFGRNILNTDMQQNGRNKVRDMVTQNNIDTIVSFNGQITSALTGADTRGYTSRLNDGELVEFRYRGDRANELNIPVYQSYPAGYHYAVDITEKRHQNLTQIRENIFIDFLASKQSDRESTLISEPSILFKIRRFYSPDLAPIELYDVTRGRWKLSDNREKAILAFSVYKNIIIEVYRIIQWFPAGTTFSTRRDAAPADRWEFIGNIAEPHYRDKYINKSVSHYFPAGARNPVRYLNI